MIELLTSAQMRAIEKGAMDAGVVTGVQLMERAGAGVLAKGLAWRPELATGRHRALVCCGPGNNGGDGYVIARLLRERGWEVRVLALGSAKTPDAQEAAGKWAGPVAPLSLAAFRAQAPADLYVDALFGTGLVRAPEGELLSLLRYWGDAGGEGPYFRARTVAVDAPSGLCLDSGRPLAGQGTVPSVGLTVTFEAPKLGHFLADGPQVCHQLEVVDLGLAAWRATAGHPVRLVDRKAWAVPVTPDVDADLLTFDKGQGHKYEHGHVIVCAGGMGRSGAARLAAKAALRVGAGAVTLAAPGNAMLECAAQVTSIMLRKCDGPDDLAALLSDAKATSVVIGPGLGLKQKHEDLVKAALRSGLACVLDADALTMLARSGDLRDLVHARCVLTPHMGEFARLFPDLAARLSPSVLVQGNAAQDRGQGARPDVPAVSKVDVTREAARRIGCTVLLKGPDTVIADADGTAFVHASVYDRAVPWLATAGAGDVLAGMIAGQVAIGHSLLHAAARGAWLHTQAARAFGPGLIAEDLPEMVPTVLRNAQSG